MLVFLVALLPTVERRTELVKGFEDLLRGSRLREGPEPISGLREYLWLRLTRGDVS